MPAPLLFFLGDDHAAVAAPSFLGPGVLLGSGFEVRAPRNVDTVADAGNSRAFQTHLMSFNNH